MSIKLKLEIPEDVYRKIEKRAIDARSENTMNYIVSILKSHVKDDHSDNFGADEEGVIRKRLKDLGYI